MQQLVQVKEESFREQLLIENEKYEQAKVRRLKPLDPGELAVKYKWIVACD